MSIHGLLVTQEKEGERCRMHHFVLRRQTSHTLSNDEASKRWNSLDVTAGILGIKAEAAQNQEKHLRLWIFECKEPSHNAFVLSVAAATLLCMAHVHTKFLVAMFLMKGSTIIVFKRFESILC
ncbi:unnamed protein product [Fraxinus pennsylvanica]|uniref:Uncharacterized protein n=1 Tax=Fraxinus pennsylvanica TaxID=56036 RepID=A0AAD2A245_9LAMI|nr:unnamed protein product [Fraxinus pennsylvanica]